MSGTLMYITMNRTYFEYNVCCICTHMNEYWFVEWSSLNWCTFGPVYTYFLHLSTHFFCQYASAQKRTTNLRLLDLHCWSSSLGLEAEPFHLNDSIHSLWGLIHADTMGQGWNMVTMLAINDAIWKAGLEETQCCSALWEPCIAPLVSVRFR